MNISLRKELAREVERVFEGNAYPGDEHFNWTETKEYKGQSWDTIPLDILLLRRDQHHYLTPEGFLYFLPSFIRALLLYSEDDVDSLLPNVFFELASTKPSPYRLDCLPELSTALNDEQRSVIHRFYAEFAELFPHSSLLDYDDGKEARSKALEFWA